MHAEAELVGLGSLGYQAYKGTLAGSQKCRSIFPNCMACGTQQTARGQARSLRHRPVRSSAAGGALGGMG